MLLNKEHSGKITGDENRRQVIMNINVVEKFVVSICS